MSRLVVSILAVVLVGGAAAQPDAAERRGKLVFAAGQEGREELFVATIGRANSRRLTRNSALDADPAWSPDGTRIAFAHRGNIALLNTDGSGFRTLTTERADSDPSWSPRGARLAFVRASSAGSTIRWLEIRGGGEGRFGWSRGGDRDPAWSPDGRLIAFAGFRDETWEVFVGSVRGGEPRRLTLGTGDDRQPSWSRDGRRIAFSSNRAGTYDLYVMRADGTEVIQLTAAPGDETNPVWSPDGARIAFTEAGALHVVRADGTGVVRLSRRQPTRSVDWQLVPSSVELLPDLDQRAPRGLLVTTVRRRFKLGFISATDNVGQGPIWIRGRRRSAGVRTMRADQLISLAGGRTRLESEVGVMRYAWSSSHSHWHLLGFQTYELRRARDFRLVVRDRKSGFCLADHWGLASRRVQGFHKPRFLSNCGNGRPGLLSVSAGTSIGYTDRYPAHFHGQSVDLTGLAAGHYVLVHRSNPRHLLRERRYDNNAASALIRITWPGGRRSAPKVRVLRYCESTERCGRS